MIWGERDYLIKAQVEHGRRSVVALDGVMCQGEHVSVSACRRTCQLELKHQRCQTPQQISLTEVVHSGWESQRILLGGMISVRRSTSAADVRDLARMDLHAEMECVAQRCSHVQPEGCV